MTVTVIAFVSVIIIKIRMSVNIRELAKSVNKNDEHAAKRARIEDTSKSNIPNFPPYENVMYSCLLSIPDILKDPNYSHIQIQDLEIEVRRLYFPSSPFIWNTSPPTPLS